MGIDHVFEGTNFRWPHRCTAARERFCPFVGVRRRELGSDGEQVALNRLEQDGFERPRLECRREPDRGVRLVDFAIRAHPWIVFRHALTAEQTRLASITGFGIDLHYTLLVRRASYVVRGCE